MKFVSLIRFRMPRTKVAEQKQFSNIQMYPAFSVEILSAASPLMLSPPYDCSACWMSAQAAITLLRTMSPKLSSARFVTLPPNQSTSPYAIKMIVKFLKIVYTGMLRNCNALVEV